MIDLNNTILTNCIIHKIGNKIKEEEIKLSLNEIELDEMLENQLNDYFLKSFRSISETHHFSHDIDLKMNEVFTCADNIFESENFVENSSNIAKHLYNQTRNPAIKPGELFIALFEEIIVENTICKGLGIFKSEKKDNFFKINETKKQLEVTIDSGINQQKLDKGCLIVNDKFHEGFKVFSYESNNADTDYWRNDFLSIKLKEDNYFQTKNFLNVCKDFVKDKLPSEFQITKADQIDLLNKSVSYFKNNENFRSNDFVKEVFEEPKIVKSFENFRSEYQNQNGVTLEESFNISTQAVKKQAKIFKSVLKLDRNFHLYIHGDKELIEKGFDNKKGLNYYKIYFQEER